MDLALWGLGAYLLGALTTASAIFIHADYKPKSILQLWYMWIFWPIVLPLRWVCYSVLSKEQGKLMQAIKNGTLPTEASVAKRIGLNILVPGMGEAYNSLIVTLNQTKAQGLAEGALTALMDTRCPKQQ